MSNIPVSQYVFSYGDGTDDWLFGGPSHLYPVSEYGVQGQGVQILSITGLEDAPTLRTQDAGRGYADGSFTGRDFLNNRSIVMQLQIFPADGQSMFTYLEQLKAHLIPQREGVNVLRIYLPGRPVQRLYARVRRRAIPINPEYTYGLGAATVEFFCPDPRIYDDVEQSEPMTVGVGNTRVYPRTYPMLYNHVPSPPTLTVSNNGDYETWPTFTITGSCSNPQLTNVDTSQSLLFPINLGASDTLVVSSDLRTVELNGVPSRNLLGGAPQWWSFPPHQQVNMTFTVTTGTASCTVTWRDAYL